MLKNVVLPAPFGPISETIAPRGTVKSTSFEATRPPNSLRIFSATSRSSGMGGVVERLVVHAFMEFGAPPGARDQAFGPDEHRHHQDDPEDAGGVERPVDVGPEGVVDRMADVREPRLVEVGEERGAEDHPPDVAH